MAKKPIVIVILSVSGSVAAPQTPPPQSTPTVIGSGTKNEAPKQIGPTILRPDPTHQTSTPQNVAVEKTPTRIPTAIKPADPATVKREDKPVVIEKPSVIPGGVSRKGLEVTKEDLARSFPGTREEILAEAKKILSTVIMEILTEVNCRQWGIKQQERYGELVEETLRLTSSKEIKDSSRHVSRLYALLQELAITFREPEPQGFAFWKKRKNPLEVFDSNRTEIEQLSHILRQQLPAISELQAKLEDSSTEFKKLLQQLDAESIAARYLADLLTTGNDSRQAFAQRLLDRSLSLSQTVAQIQQGIILRQTTTAEIGKLVSRIQEGVLVALPAWMEQVSVVQAKSALTETEMYTFQQGLDTIVAQLS